MKLIAWSDLHVHAWPAFSKLNQDGINDRLADTLRVLDEIASLAAREKASAILFGGDFFHVQRIDAEVLHLASKALENSVGMLAIPVIAIEGNHDQASKLRHLTSVSGLRTPKNWRWLRNDEARISNIAGEVLDVWGAPYGSHELPKELPDIAILHRGIFGAEVSDYFLSPFEDDLRPEDAGKYARHLVISGHYHKPQVIDGVPPILVPGAPLQHTWGDAGQERGAWVVEMECRKPGVRGSNTKLMSTKLVQLQSFPKFLRIKEENVEELEHADRNFVALEFETELPKQDLDDIVSDLSERTRGFSVQATKPESVRPSGVRLDVSTDLEHAVREYARRFGGDRNKALEELGIELLKRARS